MTEYLPLIYKISNKFPKKYRNDLVQEMFIKMHDIKNGYDIEKGTFVTYLYKNLYYHSLHYVQNNKIIHQSLDEWVTDDCNDERRKSDLLESTVNEELRFEHRDYLEQNDKRFTIEELFIREKYYELDLSVRMIIDLYSPYHGFTSPTTIYKILNK